MSKMRSASKTRIVVTCPDTGVVVITTFRCEDMTDPRKIPCFFACPCGETHKLAYVGRHGETRQEPPLGHHRAS